MYNIKAELVKRCKITFVDDTAVIYSHEAIGGDAFTYTLTDIEKTLPLAAKKALVRAEYAAFLNRHYE